jgi:hypothetical protein
MRGVARQPVDPSGVDSPAELSVGLKTVYRNRGLSYSQLDARARALPRQQDRTRALARSTLSDMLNGKVPTKETLLTFLAVCQVGAADEQQWLAAWQRVRDGDLRRPPGGVRVADASPRELGVHAAIQEQGASGDFPAYVPRDVDPDLRAAVSAGAERGCFLLLMGSSSVGKTRSAYQAVLECVPDWWLVQPANADDVHAMADEPTARTVVWLDELQRFLGEGELNAASVRALRRSGAIVIGTLWPDEYLVRTVPRRPGHPDVYRDERELLDLAEVIDVADTFSDEEQRRAAELAVTDGRLRAGLAAADPGLIQVLAAGPALVRWWEQSPDPYGKAVITAAADARRLGCRSPLTPAFLAAAVSGYLTPAQWATAPANWLDTGLTYALTPLHGAAATLTPVPTKDGLPGRVAGYAIADYLLQHARRTRRAVCLPAACWQALVDHVHDRDDMRRLAKAAEVRMRHHYAELLHRRLAADGDAGAASRLADLLERQDRTDEAITALRLPACGGVPFAHWHLVDLLLAHGRADEAIALLWPPNGDGGPSWEHAEKLIKRLVELGRAEQAAAVLRPRALAGDDKAAFHLAALLVSQGRTSEAIAVLRPHSGVAEIDWRLASLLSQEERTDDLIDLVRARTDAGDHNASSHLADLLAEHGRIDELRRRADSGDEFALRQLADWLAEHGRAEELADLSDAHHHDLPFDYLSHWLADVLADQGRTDWLRERADSGDESAPWRLAELLIDQGRMEELQERVDAGDRAATWRLAQHLERQDRLEDAVDVLRAWGDAADAGEMLAGLLIKLSRVEEAIDALRAAADADDLTTTHRLAELLAEQGHFDELRERAKDGDTYAALRLADDMIAHARTDEAINVLRAAADADGGAAAWRLDELLAQEGRIDELRERADAGGWQAARRLADVLAGRGHTQELRERADAGDRTADWRLLSLLAEQDRVDELKARADAGDNEAAKFLTRLLAAQGRIDELQAEVDAGTYGAAEQLTTSLAAQGHGKYSATHIRQFGFTADGSVCTGAGATR